MDSVVTNSMCDDMDERSEFMHTAPPPFPGIEHAVGLPPCRPSKLYTTNGLVTPFSRGITLTSREQGEADMHRRDAIRRGGR